MNTFFQKTKLYIALIIVLGGYFAIRAITKTAAPTVYVLGTATKGTVVSIVTSTGQVSTSNSVDLKPQVSGTLLSIRAKAGDKISAGETLFVLDGTDAARAVKTAQNNVASAQLDLLATQTANKNTNSDQTKAVATAYATLLSSGLQPQPVDQTTSNYQLPTITGNYTLGKEGTITITTYSSQGGISFQTSGLVSANTLTNTTTAQPIADSGLFIQFPTTVRGGLTWTITIPNKNSANYVSNENAYENALEAQAQAVDPASSNAVTLQTKQLAITQAENTLASAEETLAQYSIKAPFSGTLATVPVSVGDSISGTTLGTIITNQEIVNLSLNEVDVSKVAIGDKTTLTFGAISGLSLTGTVTTIDPVGVVSSGVVNYTVTISLDTQDVRVKSGMSVTAAVQTAVAQDVITVPNTAVKTTNGSSYVLTVPDGDISTPATTGQGVILTVAPMKTPVVIGITDGTTTEITSGLNENQSIVTKTVTTSTTTAAAAKTPTGSSLLGGGGGGGRAGVRIGG